MTYTEVLRTPISTQLGFDPTVVQTHDPQIMDKSVGWDGVDCMTLHLLFSPITKPTYAHKPPRKIQVAICNHQVDSPFHV